MLVRKRQRQTAIDGYRFAPPILVLIRPDSARVETYCSNDLLKVARWRRSKFKTAMSFVTPPIACEITLCEIPAACAAAD